MTSRNDQLFQRSQQLIPGGVNSPVRPSLGRRHLFSSSVDSGPMCGMKTISAMSITSVLGADDRRARSPGSGARRAKTAELGLSFGAPTARIGNGRPLIRLVPSMEEVRLVSSGTEATMSAIRLARGYTGRSRIVKFEGCYHGHADALLVKAGSGALTFGQPSSAGVPPEVAAHTLTLSYNDSAGVEALFSQIGGDIAAVIVEPVAGNMNLIAPLPGFLETLRAQCTKHGAVLIFDEVMTGFRVGLSSAQGLYHIDPDLTTLGKVIGGGLPVGAFGGKRAIMEKLAPNGPVYQAGTLSGNPVAVAAGMATLKQVQQPGFYEQLTARTKAFVEGLSATAKAQGIDFCAQSVGGMFGLYFSAAIPTSYAEVMQCDKEAFNRFFHAMLDEGVYLAPSAFEAGFVSATHTDAEIQFTLDAAARVFASMRAQ